MLALAVFRYHIGTGTMTCQEWKKRLAATEIKLYPHEVNQILAYFTPSDTIEVSSFIDHVVAKNRGFVEKDAVATFDRLFDSNERVSSEDISSRLNGQEFPEIAEGLKAFLSAYQEPMACMVLESSASCTATYLLAPMWMFTKAS